MMNTVEKWFKGLSNEEIMSKCHEMSEKAVEMMANGEKRQSMTAYDNMESKIVELKEHISQTNDIRSPHYDMKRQFIRDLNEIIVDCYEKMVETYHKLEKAE